MGAVDGSVGGEGVDAGPATHHRGELPAQDGLGPGTELPVGGLIDGEVERLLVDVGVADGEASPGPLHTQQLHAPLGAPGCRGGKCGATGQVEGGVVAHGVTVGQGGGQVSRRGGGLHHLEPAPA